MVLIPELYRVDSRYWVILISQEDANREWTNHERRSAQARMIAERGKEYILPVRIDDTELDGLVPTTGYLSLSEHGVEIVTNLLVKKLRGSAQTPVDIGADHRAWLVGFEPSTEVDRSARTVLPPASFSVISALPVTQ
jgi:hypothetical protein